MVPFILQQVKMMLKHMQQQANLIHVPPHKEEVLSSLATQANLFKQKIHTSTQQIQAIMEHHFLHLFQHNLITKIMLMKLQFVTAEVQNKTAELQLSCIRAFVS